MRREMELDYLLHSSSILSFDRFRSRSSASLTASALCRSDGRKYPAEISLSIHLGCATQYGISTTLFMFMLLTILP